MSNQTSPDPTVSGAPPAEPPAAPKARAKKAPAPEGIPHHAWVAGNGALQVPVAGLLSDDPSLRDASLTPEEWQKRLDEYLASPRPAPPADQAEDAGD